MTVTIAPPGAPESIAILLDYWREIVARYNDRPATAAEAEEVLNEFPSDDLAPPTGVFVVARDEDGVVGCAGLRWGTGGEAELARVFVTERARSRGWARALLDALEREALANGQAAITAEVRGDLVEAQVLYESHGYERVAPFSSGPYVDVWLRKRLR